MLVNVTAASHSLVTDAENHQTGDREQARDADWYAPHGANATIGAACNKQSVY